MCLWGLGIRDRDWTPTGRSPGQSGTTYQPLPPGAVFLCENVPRGICEPSRGSCECEPCVSTIRQESSRQFSTTSCEPGTREMYVTLEGVMSFGFSPLEQGRAYASPRLPVLGFKLM